jgi:hypothetical protein
MTIPDKPKILFLDDRSKRIHSAMHKFKNCNFTIVTTVVECLRFLSEEEWDVVFLDHDLGGHEFIDPDWDECGMEVVRYLEGTAWPPEKKRPDFVVHSSNVFGATAMEIRLKKMGFSVLRKRWEYV